MAIDKKDTLRLTDSQQITVTGITVFQKDPHALTILTNGTTKGGELARQTKAFVAYSGGWRVEGYGKGYKYTPTARIIGTVDDLATLLRGMETQKNACIIRGALRDGYKGKVHRRKDGVDGNRAPFEEVDRAWVCLDLDHTRLSAPIDPTDREQVEAAIREAARQIPELEGVSFVAQLSSSAFLAKESRAVFGENGEPLFEDGISCTKDGSLALDGCALKLHLWVLLDSPVCEKALAEWMRAHPAKLDPATSRTVQPHYTASPIFQGFPDPLPQRTFLIKGSMDRLPINRCTPSLYGKEEAQQREESKAREQREREVREREAYEESRRNFERLGLLDHTDEREARRERAWELLREAAKEIRCSSSRNPTIYAKAAWIGRIVAGDNGLSCGEAEGVLREAALSVYASEPRRHKGAFDTITRGMQAGGREPKRLWIEMQFKKPHAPTETTPPPWKEILARCEATETTGLLHLPSGLLGVALKDRDGEAKGILCLGSDGKTRLIGEKEEARGCTFEIGMWEEGKGGSRVVAFGLKAALAALESERKEGKASVVFGSRSVDAALAAARIERRDQREAFQQDEETAKKEALEASWVVVYDAANEWEKESAHEAAIKLRSKSAVVWAVERGEIHPQPVDPKSGLRRAVEAKRMRDAQEMRIFENPEKEGLCAWKVRDLHSESLPPYEIKEGTLTVKSGMGTRKTERTGEYIAKNEGTVGYISPRQTLCEDAARRLGMTSYKEIDKEDEKARRDAAKAKRKAKRSKQASLLEPSKPPHRSRYQTEERISICLPSLDKLIDAETGMVRAFDILVLDESAQNTRAIDSKIVDPTIRGLVWSIYCELIRRAKVVLALDAGMDEPTLRLLYALRGERPGEVWHNTFAMGAGGELQLYDQDTTLIERAQKAMEAGEKVFLATNRLGSNTSGEGAYNYHAALQPFGEDGILVSRPTGGEPLVRAWLSDLSNAPSHVVATPTINTGVSINAGTFDFVGAAFFSGICSPMDATQAVYRCRGASSLHVALDWKQYAIPTTTAEQRAKAFYAQRAFLRVEGGRVLRGDLLFEQTFDAYKKQDARRMEFFAWIFLVEMASYGWSVRFVENATQDPEAAKVRKDAVKSARVEAVATAKQIPLKAAKEAEKRRTTQATADSIEQAKIRSFYKIDKAAQTEEIKGIVEIDKGGTLRAQIERLEMAADSTGGIALEKQAQRLGGSKHPLRGDAFAYGLQRELYRRVLYAAGIDPSALTLRDDYTYASDTEGITTLKEWIEVWREHLPTVAQIPSPKRIDTEIVAFVGRVLKRLGLGTKKEGASASRRYGVDKERLELIRGFILQRSGLSLVSDGWEPLLIPPPSEDTFEGEDTFERTPFWGEDTFERTHPKKVSYPSEHLAALGDEREDTFCVCIDNYTTPKVSSPFALDFAYEISDEEFFAEYYAEDQHQTSSILPVSAHLPPQIQALPLLSHSPPSTSTPSPQKSILRAFAGEALSWVGLCEEAPFEVKASALLRMEGAEAVAAEARQAVREGQDTSDLCKRLERVILTVAGYLGVDGWVVTPYAEKLLGGAATA